MESLFNVLWFILIAIILAILYIYMYKRKFEGIYSG